MAHISHIPLLVFSPAATRTAKGKCQPDMFPERRNRSWVRGDCSTEFSRVTEHLCASFLLNYKVGIIILPASKSVQWGLSELIHGKYLTRECHILSGHSIDTGYCHHHLHYHSFFHHYRDYRKLGGWDLNLQPLTQNPGRMFSALLDCGYSLEHLYKWFNSQLSSGNK